MYSTRPRHYRSNTYPKPISVCVQASSGGLLLSPVMTSPKASGNYPSMSDVNSKSSRSNLELVVKRLLHAIQKLLHNLNLWSQGAVTEEDVSDVYVGLGNEFNATVVELQYLGIDTSDLMPTASDLRVILETCLSEEADDQTLQTYLPQIKRIVATLLQRLKEKQQVYRKITHLPISPSSDPGY